MKLRIQLTSIALLAVCAVGHAAEPGESVTVTLDNDVFTSSDNNYTNGLGVSWVSAELGHYDEDRFLRKWGRFWSFLPFISDDGYDTYESWSLVQEMDTPDDIKNPNPPENDQPYAGILYVDAVLYAKKDRWAHAWELKVGVVGPAGVLGHVRSPEALIATGPRAPGSASARACRSRTRTPAPPR